MIDGRQYDERQIKSERMMAVSMQPGPYFLHAVMHAIDNVFFYKMFVADVCEAHRCTVRRESIVFDDAF